MAWWSWRIFGRTRVSPRGISVGAGRLRVGTSWKSRSRPAGSAFRDSRRAWTDPEDAPDSIKEVVWRDALEDAKLELPSDEVEAILGADDDEAELMLVQELTAMKRRDRAEYEQFLALLPSDDRANVKRAM